MVAAGNLDELTIDSALAAEIEEILRLAPPAFRLGAADGDDERRAGTGRMQQGAVLARGFRRETDLLVDADVEHGVEVVDAGDRRRAFDNVARQALFLPVVGERHGDEMAAGRDAGDVELGGIAAVLGNISIDPGDRATSLPHNLRDGYARSEIVARDDDGRAARDEEIGEVRVLLLAAAAPVAAMKIDQNRRAGFLGGEDGELLPRRRAPGAPQQRSH